MAGPSSKVLPNLWGTAREKIFALRERFFERFSKKPRIYLET